MFCNAQRCGSAIIYFSVLNEEKTVGGESVDVVLCQNFFRDVGLQWGETKIIVLVVADNKIDSCIAEITHAVEKDCCVMFSVAHLLNIAPYGSVINSVLLPETNVFVYMLINVK